MIPLKIHCLIIEADPLRLGSNLFTGEIWLRTSYISTVKLRGVVTRAVDGSNALDWTKLPLLFWLFLAGFTGVSETALHLCTSKFNLSRLHDLYIGGEQVTGEKGDPGFKPGHWSFFPCHHPSEQWILEALQH